MGIRLGKSPIALPFLSLPLRQFTCFVLQGDCIILINDSAESWIFSGLLLSYSTS
jgi:hypothetical protein